MAAIADAEPGTDDDCTGVLKTVAPPVAAGSV
jgi:hypothetical protein